MDALELFAIVEADLEQGREIMKDIVENTVDDTDTEPTANGAKGLLADLDGGVRDPKEPYHKVVKITIEDVTTLEDAIADRASE